MSPEGNHAKARGEYKEEKVGKTPSLRGGGGRENQTMIIQEIRIRPHFHTHIGKKDHVNTNEEGEEKKGSHYNIPRGGKGVPTYLTTRRKRRKSRDCKGRRKKTYNGRRKGTSPFTRTT